MQRKDKTKLVLAKAETHVQLLNYSIVVFYTIRQQMECIYSYNMSHGWSKK